MTAIECTASTLCDQENHLHNINSSGRGSNLRGLGGMPFKKFSHSEAKSKISAVLLLEY